MWDEVLMSFCCLFTRFIPSLSLFIFSLSYLFPLWKGMGVGVGTGESLPTSPRHCQLRCKTIEKHAWFLQDSLTPPNCNISENDRIVWFKTVRGIHNLATKLLVDKPMVIITALQIILLKLFSSRGFILKFETHQLKHNLRIKTENELYKIKLIGFHFFILKKLNVFIILRVYSRGYHETVTSH